MKSLLISAIALSFVFTSCTKEKIDPVSTPERNSARISEPSRSQRVSASLDETINTHKLLPVVNTDEAKQVLRIKIVTGK